MIKKTKECDPSFGADILENRWKHYKHSTSIGMLNYAFAMTNSVTSSDLLHEGTIPLLDIFNPAQDIVNDYTLAKDLITLLFRCHNDA